MVRIFILTVGHNGSGKTTITKKLSRALGISCVEGDDVRRFLRDHITYFHDLDFSHPNPKARIVSELTFDFRLDICQKLLEQGQPAIHVSATPTREYRRKIIEAMIQRVGDIRVVLLYAKASDDEILERLRQRDIDEPNQLGWAKHYTEIKRPIFEEPTADEADELIEYDQKNYYEVEQKIKEALSRT